jgi:hypothetical protein
VDEAIAYDHQAIPKTGIPFHSPFLSGFCAKLADHQLHPFFCMSGLSCPNFPSRLQGTLLALRFYVGLQRTLKDCGYSLLLKFDKNACPHVN